MTMKHASNSEGQYFLISTYGSLLLVDLVNMEQVVIHRGYKLYFGITKSDKHIYVGATHFGKQFLPSEILVFDYDFNLLETIKPNFPFCEVHEILYHDNKLYTINTAYNMVAIYDGSAWEQWYPLEKPDEKLAYRKQDINHFNSISIYRDEIYLLAHNRGPSTIHIYKLHDRRKTHEVNIGVGAHNIWIENDTIYVCSSHEGTIVNTQGFIKKIAEWPRGIALCKNSIIVGSSALGGHTTTYTTHNAHLYIYSKSWKAKGIAVLHGEGQVNDIFPIELCGNPAQFFNDNRFEKKILLGLNNTLQVNKEIDFLLNLYATSSIRVGRQTLIINTLNTRISKIEKLLLIDKLVKIKKYITKLFNK